MTCGLQNWRRVPLSLARRLASVARKADNRFMPKLRVCITVVIAILASASLNANSQCVVMTAAQLKGFAEVVLLGQVVAVERERLRSILTVEVERVWKGTAPKRLTLFQYHVDPNRTRFQVGETYVIFAGQAFRPTVFSDYVDDCNSKPASSFNLADLGDSTSPQQ